MKLITTNQLKFTGTLVLLTLTFRYGLTRFLDQNEFVWVGIIAAAYGVLAFMAGWFWGKKDYESLPLVAIGFRFHLITYLVCNTIGELWFFLNLNSQYDTVIFVHWTALIWGIGLLIHFLLFLYFRKNTIKGIEKSEIFE